ncbi:MAG: hypothetical protein IKD12_06880 [Paludibacteraceae bacterium]|nr:hypothetical protein [Paludibacteraceae bacterium]
MALSNEEKLLKERIRHMLTYKRMSISKIAEGDETLRVKLGRQINGEDTSVQFSVLYMLLYMFPDIDANWLILGEGQMTKTTDHPRIYNHNEANGSSAGGSIYVGTSTIPYPVQALLDEKDKRIAELESNNKTMRTILDSMTAGTRKQ